MNERITNKQVQDFLDDFEKYGETIILEEGKEKNEILAIAKNSRINLQNNRDLAGFKTIYTFANKANKNRARLPKKVLLQALPGMIGKPVDIDHKRKYVVGHYIDYRYKQKEDMVIAYGVFYKSNFGKEWEKAKQLFKAKKLATSYEIWCPDEQRKFLADGTYELLYQEIAGGALLFKEPPAFEDAKVLEFAMKNTEKYEDELVFAKYKNDELIIGGDGKTMEESNPTQPAPRLKCSNCGEEFEYHDIGEVKCPKCFAILNKTGQLIYPPQLIDFKVICPSCRVNRWRLLSKSSEEAKLRCLNCAKKYDITFSKSKSNKDIAKLDFVYIGAVSCHQCNKVIEFSGVSSVSQRNFTCPRCGLQFAHDVTRQSSKKIATITEIKQEKSSEKGGKTMDDKKKTVKASEAKPEVVKKEEAKKVEKPVEKKEEPKKVEKKSEVKPAEKPKVEDKKAIEPSKAKVEDAPKAEVNKDDEKPTVKEPKKPEEVKMCDKCKKESCDCPKEVKPTVKAKVEEPKKSEVKPAEKPKVEKPKAEEPKKAEVTLTDKEKKYAKGIRKLASKIRALRKSTIEKVAFYKANAEEINKRRADLGDSGKGLSDVDILNDEKFATIKAEKENTKIEKSSEIVGTKEKDVDYYSQKRKEIDGLAFPS